MTSVTKASERVLALVPARGGSKGIPRKNLQLLAGRSLVAHAVQAGLDAQLVSRVLCSTDDVEIAEAARAAGAEVPFLRPAELAQDRSEDWPVFMHAVDWLEAHEGWVPDLVVNLRPTSPLRTPRHVDDAIRLLIESGVDSVKAVCLARQHPHKMWLLKDRVTGDMEPFLKTPVRLARGPDIPRAELDDVYWQNGVVDVTRLAVLREQRVMIGTRVAGLVTLPEESIDIDTPLDLQLAELLFVQRAARAGRGAQAGGPSAEPQAAAEQARAQRAQGAAQQGQRTQGATQPSEGAAQQGQRAQGATPHAEGAAQRADGATPHAEGAAQRAQGAAQQGQRAQGAAQRSEGAAQRAQGATQHAEGAAQQGQRAQGATQRAEGAKQA